MFWIAVDQELEIVLFQRLSEMFKEHSDVYVETKMDTKKILLHNKGMTQSVYYLGFDVSPLFYTDVIAKILYLNHFNLIENCLSVGVSIDTQTCVKRTHLATFNICDPNFDNDMKDFVKYSVEILKLTDDVFTESDKKLRRDL